MVSSISSNWSIWCMHYHSGSEYTWQQRVIPSFSELYNWILTAGCCLVYNLEHTFFAGKGVFVFCFVLFCCLVSLFYRISTCIGNLMPKPLKYYSTHSLNVNVIARLEFELAHYDVTVQHVSHDARCVLLFCRGSSWRILNPIDKTWFFWFIYFVIKY